MTNMELFVKKVYGFQLLTDFGKTSILDVLQSSEYIYDLPK